MSKWRPLETSCLYVIPDIHGMYNELQLILNRILPLRKNNGICDKLIFLGDYIDRRISSHQVVDLIMEVQQDHPEQVFCLRGNHEQLLLKATSDISSLYDYNMWMKNGGDVTLQGYLEKGKYGITNPYIIPRKNIGIYIPADHINFFNKTLLDYYEDENYIFVHGGCDPFIPLNKQDKNILIWDRSVFTKVYNELAPLKLCCPWKKTIITGHNGQPTGNPFVYDKFMMLDCSGVEKVLVMELNSRECFYAKKGNAKLTKQKIG